VKNANERIILQEKIQPIPQIGYLTRNFVKFVVSILSTKKPSNFICHSREDGNPLAASRGSGQAEKNKNRLELNGSQCEPFNIFVILGSEATPESIFIIKSLISRAL